MDNFKALPFQVNQKIVDLCLVKNELYERHKEESQKSHDELWAAVHEEYPELDADGSFTLKTEFSEQGVVMITEHVHDSDCIVGKLPVKLAGLLKRAMKDIN